METSSGSPPSDGSGTPPERLAPPFVLSGNNAESARGATPMEGEEAAETSAAEALDVTPQSTAPETGIARETTGAEASVPTGTARGSAAYAPETRPLAPPSPPPLRYGEPRPAIAPNRVGEPIRVGEPPVTPRVQGEPNAATQVPSFGATSRPAEALPGQNQETTAYAPQPQLSTPTPYTPQPSQSPQPAPQPQPRTQPETPPPAYPYAPQPSYSPPPASAAAPPTASPRPYGTSGPAPYPPLPTAGVSAAPPSPGAAIAPPAGYAPANTLTPTPVATHRTSGTNNTLLAVIAILLAVIAIVQVLNLMRPTRLDTSESVPVQTKALSQTTRDQVKNTLDNAQKAITDINTQAQMDYNAATTDAQRQAILAKYSFTLQQIIAQEQYDMLRIMQEQSTP